MEQLNLQAIRSRVITDSGSNRHIFFGVDSNFIFHALITVMSIIEHADHSVYHFHIISSEFDEGDAAKFSEVLAGRKHGLTVHHAGDDMFSSLPTTALFTRATYYRLLAPQLVPYADHVLYLDADMVCIKSLDPLWLLAERDPNVVAFVVGEIENLQKALAENVGLKKTDYFNAGMMLINVQKWKQTGISEKALQALTNSEKPLQYLDQDALNIVLEGNVCYVDRRFNHIEMLAHNAHSYSKDVPANTCVIHYAGADKPWQQWNQQKVCQYYQKIYRHSPVASRPFDLPRNHYQAKKMYKTMFRTHQLLRGVYWRLRYFQMRYF
ncbi:glycosyltransferase family 8 protein [Rahnella sikkimica]|uniref:Lipopolysaccharide 1,3-galactosyltransferase n=1 Tax=Rahnella sikkimica TaxID=1805933 RepID=A0A2L1UYV2_9GAMM|nr:glycosyltransferase [Rahnella sikkimica]AVF38139.1 lipopolysaccharide 1,3-galactosyltransferase [Rahnella sikkimica]